jgi:hypothetical protein
LLRGMRPGMNAEERAKVNDWHPGAWAASIVYAFLIWLAADALWRDIRKAMESRRIKRMVRRRGGKRGG